MYIEKIKSPADVKRLTEGELVSLSTEIRAALIKKLGAHGGHCGPNLGMVEATVALHYVFDSPVDKLVFDVSHQSYVHKILTGRNEAFIDAEHYGDVSGYSEPSESEHDHFVIGHTSTSVSLASGLAKGRDLVGGQGNVVAIIGDGSLSGGEAFEGLDYAAELGTNFIVVVNDNQMSIAENHGGLYANLAELRETAGMLECNYFRSLGFDYCYVDRGNDVAALIKAFQRVKDIDHPIVVHINTTKGLGYSPAVTDKETWHWHVPFDVETGAPLRQGGGEDYCTLTADCLLDAMKTDSAVVAIVAGVPASMGFTPDRRKAAGSQFVDVGIAEEHAVALASGIAKAGGKSVFGTYSTFMQRAYDQISQDLCINNNPATLLVFWGSLATMNDVTHLCHFDIPMLSNIPNLVYLAPTNRDEYLAMLKWSLDYKEHPVAIRVPVLPLLPATRPVETDYSVLDRYELVHRGKDVAILALGNFYGLGEAAAARLEEAGVNATLISPRYISGVDTELLDSLKADHRLVITLEDGVLDGGFGEKIARYYGPSSMKVLCYGAKKTFVDRYNLKELMREYRLVDTMLADDALAALR